MKKICWLFLLAVGTVSVLKAQTNPAPTVSSAPATSPAPAPALARQITEILSDQLEWNMRSNVQIRSGNVRVTNPQYKMTCDRLTAAMAQLADNKFQQGTAEGRVVIDWLNDRGETNHASADQAVYTYSVTNSVTNAIVKLSGHAQVVRPDGSSLRGEPITWNRVTDELVAHNERTVIEQSGTNSPSFFETPRPARTNAPKAAPDAPKP